ncbi:hypothetical protein AUC71_07140 [Methyloceanibacter marginalis]|jgi:Ca2+-binding EF-hand superfamily protein|uniref:EF-hand domain-containing protein n=1 Tax=Methyloceanibacter marginalis TaxID=1774971 RepID=A0A1E3WEF7_9HYPH|nr:hypothetical protein [Methyloceanibacter marginalis]ODS03902.1 hypothetical protein AUC71_07140 [Methyloceanibacter marginalis]
MRKLAQTFSIAATALFLTASPTFAADTAAALKALDPDNDGTIDMKEAIAGAKKVFKTINTDDDKTLEADELQGMLDAEGLDAADPDDDDSLDWKEYRALVKAKFKAANPDDDGTIDLKELESPAGQELMTLIYK